MNLRDDFEKEWSGFDFTRDSTGSYVDSRVENFWNGYQAATARALQIVEEEGDKHTAFSKEGKVLFAVEQRIKGES